MDGEARRRELERQIERDVWQRATAANVGWVGLAATLFVLLSPAPGRPYSTTDLVIATAAVASIASALLVPIAVWQSRRLFRAATRWIAEDRAPTEDERRAVHELAWRQASIPPLYWAVGLAVLGVLCLRFYDFGFIFVRFLFGGAVGCLGAWLLSLLLVERALGPLYGVTMTASPARASRFGMLRRVLACVGVGVAGPAAALTLAPDWAGLSLVQWVIMGLGVAVSLVLLTTTVRGFTRPLGEVETAIRRVEAGDLDVEIPVDDGGEIGELQLAMNHMVSGLRERARLSELFGHHVGAEVARHALEHGEEFGGEVRSASALFVDIVGSSALALDRPPQELLATLNRFFEAVGEVVAAHGGMINKFHGDGALCVFGAPDHQDDHARRALCAARLMREAILEIAADDPEFDAGIGLSSGIVVAGNVGAHDRYEYTVVGDPVNEAARLCDAAKRRPRRVLASHAAIEAADEEAAAWSHAGTVQLRGQNRSTPVYEPFASTGAAADEDAAALSPE
ncbi:MAG: adenylate/guanylate cyclase domain-containing protein [Acidimicrobiia bacterium]|nr:adenylate/guanylate cyclase domain-containing protein [Acidimicrobiia bacterium]